MKIDHNAQSCLPMYGPKIADDLLDHCWKCGLRFYKKDKKEVCSLCGEQLHDKPKERT